MKLMYSEYKLCYTIAKSLHYKLNLKKCTQSYNRISNFSDSDCNDTLSLTNLPSYVNCHIGSSCNEVQCCLDIDRVGKTLDVFLRLDACRHTLTLGIEDLEVEYSLLSFTFGVDRIFHVDRVFVIE